jgi:nicotinate-nucleotide adenylyltransferase
VQRRSGIIRVGLLGGSFNPAHDGHRAISLAALRAFGLDQVWWLVSPQNPLKPEHGMAKLADRIAAARRAARHPRIKVTDLERRLGTRYTVDTARRLMRQPGGVRFVWLMGADNLLQLPRWRRWIEFLQLMPIAVLDRQTATPALAGKAARRFAAARRDPLAARHIADMNPPAWAFLAIRRHPTSATAIRRGH